MLDNVHINQLNEIMEKQEQEIENLVQDVTCDIIYNFKTDASRIISKEKEPYFKEILDSYQTNSTIENKYNASDILTILENIFDELRLTEIEE